MWPETEADFVSLKEQGKQLECIETADQQDIPVGEGWEFWSMKITPDESKAVWRRIVTVSD